MNLCLMNLWKKEYSPPPSMRSALITLILKPGKPPNEKSSYRPISLMSCDTKILCKALVKRIETYIPNQTTK